MQPTDPTYTQSQLDETVRAAVEVELQRQANDENSDSPPWISPVGGWPTGEVQIDGYIDLDALIYAITAAIRARGETK